MAAPTVRVLTEEQLRKQVERKAAKLAKQQAAAKAASVSGAGSVGAGAGAGATALVALEEDRRRFLRREWIDLVGKGADDADADRGEEKGKGRVRIVTWNMLAQTLVRRELFPGSDCLRWTDRRPMLLAELETFVDCDVVCLQECDRLSHLTPSLPHHSYVNASGPGKLHGLVIFYRNDRWSVKASRTVYLDDEELQPDLSRSARERRGGSRQTKNVGLIVALEDTTDANRGIVVATTHLFWHPKFAYERSRQSLLLIQNIRTFQAELRIGNWPAVLAGDLNTQPNEATYQLLTNPLEPLPLSLAAEIETSRFVHTSVDKIGEPQDLMPDSNTASGVATPASADKDDGEDDLPDTDERSVANTRSPTEGDGIIPTTALIKLARQLMPDGGCRSAFTSAAWTSERSETFAGRGEHEARLIDGGLGGGEPRYTCFSPLFRLTLDYLFLLPSQAPAQVTAVLRPATAQELEPGLPRKGVCAADHLAMGAEIAFCASLGIVDRNTA